MEILKGFTFDVQRHTQTGTTGNFTNTILSGYTGTGVKYYDGTEWKAATELAGTESLRGSYDGDELIVFAGSTVSTDIAKKINVYSVLTSDAGSTSAATKGGGDVTIDYGSGSTGTLTLAGDKTITLKSGGLISDFSAGITVKAGTVKFSGATGTGNVTTTTPAAVYTLDNVTASIDYEGAITDFTGTSVTVGTSKAKVEPSGGSASLTANAGGVISVLKNASLTSAADATAVTVTDSTSKDSVIATGASSTLTANASGEFTLTGGTFTATTGSYTVDATKEVKVGTDTANDYITFGGGSTGTYESNTSFTLTSAGSVAGVTASDAAANLTDGTHVYTTNAAGTFKFVQIGSSSYLYDAANGTVQVSAKTVGDEILIASKGAVDASTTAIKFSTGSAGYITVKNDGSYTIAGMTDGQKVTIDGQEFTYANVGGKNTLTYGTTVYTFTGSIQATIQGGSGSFTDSFTDAVITDTTRTIDAVSEIGVSLKGAASAVNVLGASVPNFKDGDDVYYVPGTAYGVLDGSTISGAKLLGRLNYNSTEDVRTYTVDSNSGAQIINLTGAGTANTGAIADYVWNIVGGNGADTIYGNAALASTLDGGSGNDEIHAAQKNIAFGGAGNDYIIGGNAADISLSGGAGADTLVGANATTTLTGGDGADVFVLNDGTARTGVITDYNFTEDVLYVDGAALPTNLVTAKNYFTNEGVLDVTGVGTATVNGSNGSYQVMLQNADKKKLAVGWVGEEATSIDFFSQNVSVSSALFGTQNDAGDSLYGGSGNDLILAGSGDTVWGASGTNTINLTQATESITYGFGVASGAKKEKDTVTGFKTGFDADTSDKVYLVGDTSNFKSTLTGGGTTLTMKMGNAEASVGVRKTTATNTVDMLFGDLKASFIASNDTASVESADYANVYYGTKNGTVGSGLSFAKAEGDVSVNLSDNATYRNISTLTGGTGNSTLIGSSAKETLVSAGGNTSLWGGAGSDVLKGADNAKDVFFLMAEGGKDTVSGFGAYTENTADTADVVYLGGLESAKLTGNGVEFQMNTNDKLVLSGLNANSEIQFTTDGTNIGVAKIGSVSGANNFTYAKEVSYYGGGSKVDTLTVSGDVDANIWLDNSKDNGVLYSSVEAVNAQNSTGSLLIAGNDSVNTITAGRGDATLWGGVGSSKDYVKGSTSGTTAFFYGKGEGNDTLVASSADDVVYLYNMTLDDIASGEIGSSSIVLNMKNGDKLTVQTSKDVTFSMTDGSKYVTNHTTGKFD